jgi:hypothetical protein
VKNFEKKITGPQSVNIKERNVHLVTAVLFKGSTQNNFVPLYLNMLQSGSARQKDISFEYHTNTSNRPT